MILEALERASENVRKFYQAQGNQQRHASFLNSANALDGHIGRLDHYMDIAEAAKGDGLPLEVGMTESQSNQLLAIVREMGEKLEQRNLAPSDVKAFSALVDAAQKEYQLRWQRATTRVAGSLPGYLQMVASLLEDPHRAQSLRAALEDAGRQLPQTAASIRSFIKIVDESKAIIDKMQVTDEVRAFLTKLVIEQTATIADLSEHVMKWIKERKLEKRLSIGFAKSK